MRSVGVNLLHVYDAVGALKEGRRTDALLDSISAVGVGMATVGFATSPSGTGLALIVVGIGILVVAQTIKSSALPR